VLALSGPTPIHVTGTPVNSSILSTYFLAFLGNLLYSVTFEMSLSHLIMLIS